MKLKPHNLAEEITLPAFRKIAKTMNGGAADIKISKIPLSNNTMHRKLQHLQGFPLYFDFVSFGFDFVSFDFDFVAFGFDTL
jgi:hypothetical protein